MGTPTDHAGGSGCNKCEGKHVLGNHACIGKSGDIAVVAKASVSK